MNQAAALPAAPELAPGLSFEAAIARAVAAFGSNELAYLALTSKPEGALRDRIALAVRKHIEDTKQRLLVAREFGRRADLAVVGADDCAPQVLVEFKCWHTTNVTELIEKLAADVTKCRYVHTEWAPGVPAYVVLALTHPSKAADKRLDKVVKYQGEVRREHTGRASSVVLTEFVARLTDVFPELQRLNVPTGLGSEFGVEVDLHWFVMGPISTTPRKSEGDRDGSESDESRMSHARPK